MFWDGVSMNAILSRFSIQLSVQLRAKWIPIHAMPSKLGKRDEIMYGLKKGRYISLNFNGFYALLDNNGQSYWLITRMWALKLKIMLYIDLT